MASIISERVIKAFEKFNADLRKFGNETGEVFVTLYEDANTTRKVSDFHLYKNGKLKWVELDLRYNSKIGGYENISCEEVELMSSDDEARDYLSFWRGNLRRAKRYWSMNTDIFDRIQNGEIEDTE